MSVQKGIISCTYIFPFSCFPSFCVWQSALASSASQSGARVLTRVGMQPDSVTRWQDYLPNIWSFRTATKICPMAIKFGKVDLKPCQIPNIPSKCCKRPLKFYQSGVIWRNQVTLQPDLILTTIDQAKYLTHKNNKTQRHNNTDRVNGNTKTCNR